MDSEDNLRQFHEKRDRRRDPWCGIRKKLIPDSDPGGKKNTGFRIRIHNTGCNEPYFFRVLKRRLLKLLIGLLLLLAFLFVVYSSLFTDAASSQESIPVPVPDAARDTKSELWKGLILPILNGEKFRTVQSNNEREQLELIFINTIHRFILICMILHAIIV
jgi:hypothetical protein